MTEISEPHHDPSRPLRDRLTAAQIRGARAMLNWSMVHLAQAARVSVSTIKCVENGSSYLVSESVLGTIQDVLEAEGVRFLPDDGSGPGTRLLSR